jgi:OmpA-OmpF porin, OOP family
VSYTLSSCLTAGSRKITGPLPSGDGENKTPRKEIGTMQKLLLASLCAVIFTGSASAADEKGFYLRGLLGQAEVDESSFSDEDTAFSIGGGWRFLPYLSVEGGYSDFGSLEGNSPNAEFSADSWETGVAAKIPFGESGFFGQARLGYHWWDIDTRFVNGRGSIDGSDPYYGVGVGYDFNPQFGVSLNFDRYEIEDFEIDRIGLGGEFRF